MTKADDSSGNRPIHPYELVAITWPQILSACNKLAKARQGRDTGSNGAFNEAPMRRIKIWALRIHPHHYRIQA